MPTLFLDIDGVLNHFETQVSPDGTFLDYDCVQQLNRICENVPSTTIILCSAWRKHDALRTNEYELQRFSFKYKLSGETPILRGIENVNAAYHTTKHLGYLPRIPGEREFEIYTFLQHYTKAHNDTLVMLDDLCIESGSVPRHPSLYGTFFSDHCVKTSEGNDGLNKERADKVIELLANGPKYIHKDNPVFTFYKEIGVSINHPILFKCRQSLLQLEIDAKHCAGCAIK